MMFSVFHRDRSSVVQLTREPYPDCVGHFLRLGWKDGMSLPILRLLSGLVLGVSLMQPLMADVISLRADNWCPHNCDPKAANPGYMVEIARKVFEGAGHQVDYQILNWARAIEETRAGHFTGIIGTSRGDAPDFVFPGIHQGRSVNAFAALATDGWTYAGIDSLKGRVLGVVRDYSYGEEIDAYIKVHLKDPARIQVTSGDNALELNLRKMQKGRINTVVEGEAVLKYNLQLLGLDKDMKMAGADSLADPIFVAFSPANPNSAGYAALLSKGMEELKASGELSNILAKYGLSE